jgi:hypothetical protein
MFGTSLALAVAAAESTAHTANNRKLIRVLIGNIDYSLKGSVINNNSLILKNHCSSSQ